MLKSKKKLIVVHERYCDFCSKLIKEEYTKCLICSRDCCDKHRDHHPLFPESHYAHIVCVSCKKISKPYVKKINEIRDKAEDERLKLEDEMEKACKRAAKI